MGMIHEILSPGMQNDNAPDFGAEMLSVMGEFHKRCGGRAKEQIVHDLLIHGYQVIQFCGEGKNHMEIGNREKIRIVGLDPFFLGQCLAFGTMPVSAGVI